MRENNETDSPLARSLDARLEYQRQRIQKHKEFLNRQRDTSILSVHDESIDSETIHRVSDSPVSTPVAPTSKSNGTIKREKVKRIEEALLDYGRQLEEHKEQMRQQFLRSQEETFHPHISESSKLMGKTQFDNLDVIDRLDLLDKERVEKLEQMQKEKDTIYSHKPTISKASQELALGNRSNIVEVNKTWVDHREQRLTTLRERKFEEEIEEETFAPKLNPNTYKIVNRMRQQKRREDEGIPFEDYLEKKEIERQKELYKKTEEHYHQLVSKTPKITQRAAEIVREGSVTDRLYEQSFKLNEKRIEYQQQKQLKEQEEYDFTPRVNTIEIEREEPVYEHLIKREEQKRLKKMEDMEKLLAQEKELHHPKINPVSEEIASRLPNSTKERLLKTTKSSKHDQENYSFKPEINPRSRQMAAQKSGNRGVLSRIDRLYSQDKRKKERLRQMRNMYDQKELESCTFQPKTTKLDINAKPFSERSEQWEKKKKAKIAHERAVVELKSMQECTFRPTTNAEKRMFDHKSKSGEYYSGGFDDPLGFEEFVQRQREARLKKVENEKGVFNTGNKWQNKVTVPKEFNLGQRRTLNIKSLKKPLSPSQQKRLTSEEMYEYEDEEEEEQNILDSTEEDEEEEEDSEEDNSEEEETDGEDEDDGLADLLSEVPPQGLFSSRSSVSILEGMQHLYQASLSRISEATEIHSTPNKPALTTIPHTSEEWLKRSKQKEEESKNFSKTPTGKKRYAA